MISKELVLKLIKSKKSNKYSANRIGVSIEEWINLKNHYKNENLIKQKITEFSENLNEGTAKYSGISYVEPKSAEDIEKILKIDTDKWKLSTYWNKQHSDFKGNEYWTISALVSQKKENELSFSDVENIIKTTFNNNNISPIKNKINKITNKKALFVYTSDKHIAAYVDNQESIYENKYDGLTFQARMKLVIHEINYLVNLFGVFEDIFIIDLGDKMDGLNAQTTRGGHKLPQNLSNKEAFNTALSVEKDFYDYVFTSDFANNYTVLLNANSNHGGFFDYIVNKTLELYINIKYPFVKIQIQEKFIEHIEYGKHILLLTHGKDTEDMKHGLPLNVNDKVENYINKYIIYHQLDSKNKFVSLVKGDLHINNSQDTYNFRYRNVLSLFGGSKWISTNFGPSHPGCSFDIIEKDTKRIFEHKIIF